MANTNQFTKGTNNSAVQIAERPSSANSGGSEVILFRKIATILDPDIRTAHAENDKPRLLSPLDELEGDKLKNPSRYCSPITAVQLRRSGTI